MFTQVHSHIKLHSIQRFNRNYTKTVNATLNERLQDCNGMCGFFKIEGDNFDADGKDSTNSSVSGKLTGMNTTFSSNFNY